MSYEFVYAGLTIILSCLYILYYILQKKGWDSFVSKLKIIILSLILFSIGLYIAQSSTYLITTNDTLRNSTIIVMANIFLLFLGFTATYFIYFLYSLKEKKEIQDSEVQKTSEPTREKNTLNKMTSSIDNNDRLKNQSPESSLNHKKAPLELDLKKQENKKKEENTKQEVIKIKKEHKTLKILNDDIDDPNEANLGKVHYFSDDKIKKMVEDFIQNEAPMEEVGQEKTKNLADGFIYDEKEFTQKTNKHIESFLQDDCDDDLINEDIPLENEVEDEEDKDFKELKQYVSKLVDEQSRNKI